MPLEGNREPDRSHLYYLHPEVLKDRYHETAKFAIFNLCRALAKENYLVPRLSFLLSLR